MLSGGADNCWALFCPAKYTTVVLLFCSVKYILHYRSIWPNCPIGIELNVVGRCWALSVLIILFHSTGRIFYTNVWSRNIVRVFHIEFCRAALSVLIIAEQSKHINQDLFYTVRSANIGRVQNSNNICGSYWMLSGGAGHCRAFFFPFNRYQPRFILQTPKEGKAYRIVLQILFGFCVLNVVGWCWALFFPFNRFIQDLRTELPRDSQILFEFCVLNVVGRCWVLIFPLTISAKIYSTLPKE